MDVIKSPTGPLVSEYKIVYLWRARELEAICSAQASQEAPSCSPNVIKINSGRPHLMRINAGADESTCPSPTTHAYQPVIDCGEWLQVWVCVLCNLWEHLVHAGFVRFWTSGNEEKLWGNKIEGENWMSSLAWARFAFFFKDGIDSVWTIYVATGNQNKSAVLIQPY